MGCRRYGGGGGSFGSGTPGFVNGNVWYNVRFNSPTGLTKDTSHKNVYNNYDIYVADAGNNAIRKIAVQGSLQSADFGGGLVTTFAGNGTAGFANGTGGGAQFNNPTGVVADQLGNLYVADAGNNMIRKITPGRTVTTFAGAGTKGATDGNATAATFNNPQGIAIDDEGVLYIADTDNNLVRSVSTTGYAINPALPAGLNFDATTGTISGTPLRTIAAADYTVTAYNTRGSSTATINIAVTGMPPPRISYPANPHVFARGITITPLIPGNTGGPVPANVYSNVTTVSGSATAGSLNGPKSLATFNGPSAVAVDSAGSIYVADYGNYQVRRITYSGVVGTFAGTGSPGAENYVRSNAGFNSPAGLTIDTGGNLYVADPDNFKIRKINTLGGVSTAAGRGIRGELNGIPGNSSFNKPFAVTIDADGNILIADTYNNAIRKLVPGVGVTTINAGVIFNRPEGIIADASGNIFVSDFGSNKIYKITRNGTTYAATIFAGSGTAGMADGNSTAASFSGPRGITLDYLGNLYVADYNNSLIRKITPAGVVTTFAGISGVHGSLNGLGKSSSFWNPAGLATDKDNNILVADYSNNMIRKISLTGYSITPELPLGLIFNATTGTISGTPRQTLPATNYTIIAYNAAGSSSTTISIEVRQPGSMFLANNPQDTPVETGEPNVSKMLSPNGDGNNDILTVENIEQYPDNKMIVLNAAGSKVYEASGYGVDGKLFDGHSNAGRMQAAGTYFYILEYNTKDGNKRKSGYFVIKE